MSLLKQHQQLQKDAKEILNQLNHYKSAFESTCSCLEEKTEEVVQLQHKLDKIALQCAELSIENSDLKKYADDLNCRLTNCLDTTYAVVNEHEALLKFNDKLQRRYVKLHFNNDRLVCKLTFNYFINAILLIIIIGVFVWLLFM